MSNIDRLDHSYWLSNMEMELSHIDIRTYTERMVEHRIMEHAKSLGLEPWDLMDCCLHRWHDMEDPEDYKWFYGEDAFDYEIKPTPPGRWLLLSTWLIRERAYPKVNPERN